MTFTEDEMLDVRTVPVKGRGVFALRSFSPGERIESAPVIVVPAAEWPLIEKTVFFHYSYSWGPRLEHAAVALGCGSLYNHSYAPNAEYVRRLAEERIDFLALREIAAGEEITINYNGAAGDPSPLWFEPVA
jgi:SET domain-containing protein